MKVISLGAGVQSTTLLLMALHGEVEADLAIFADTMREPKAVYEHLSWLISYAGARGFEVINVSKGDLMEDYLNSGKRAASLPLFTRTTKGAEGKLRRQCTSEYKIMPVRAKITELLGGNTRGKRVELLMGISLDEVHRMKPSGVQYIENVYPLVERRMTRHDCERWLLAHGYDVPPKSACTFCPFHDNKTWKKMRDSDPESWAEAVEFDEKARRARTQLKEEAYVHRSLVPLSEVDLRDEEDAGQMDLFDGFDAECSGVCGV